MDLQWTRDLLLFAWVLRGVEYLLLPFTSVLRWYLLKPMRIRADPYTQFLKSMQIATKETPRGTQNGSKVLKTHAYSSKHCSQSAAEPEDNSDFGGPARGGSLRPRTPAQLRLARSHARTNRNRSRNRNRLPGLGGTHSTHSPKPPIYIYIYIYIISDFLNC